MPLPSSMFNKKPLHALESFVVSPAKLSSLVSASAFAAPSAAKNLLSNFAKSSEPVEAKVNNDLPPTIPTNSIALFNDRSSDL